MPRPCPPKCCIKDCKSTSQYNTIYFFPKNKKLRRKWVKVISYSDPEFVKKEESQIMKLGVCDEHFMSDQCDDNGKRKRNAYPNTITQQEVDVGMPIISYDSDSDAERIISSRKKRSPPALQEIDSESDIKRKIPKRNEQSTMVETEIKIEYEEICRLCLATGVKMFSLNSEPLKQYFTFIAPCIDEWEMFPSEKFPTAVCYLCTNSLKTCYEFGKLCAQSQSVLTEYYLNYSKINTLGIKQFAKNKIKLHRNLNKYSLPSVFIEPENVNQDQVVLDSQRKKLRPSNSNLVLIKSDLADKSPKIKEVKKEVVYDVSNDFGFGDLEKPSYLQKDQTSLDEEILGPNESDLGVATTSDYNAKVNLSTKDTECIITLPPNIEQTNEPSTSVTKKAAYTQLQSTERKAQEPVTDTPTLSEATISTLKKSVLKSHGEVEVKRMYYQGGDIHVIMVNAEGKEVLLKLSPKANAQPVVNKQPLYQLPKDVKFNKNCWSVHPLSKKEQYLLIRNRQNKQHYKKALFKCLTCFKSFHHLSSYNAHIEKHDPLSGDFICRICKMYFETKTQLLNHERTHSTMYICKMCPHTVNSKIDAKEHQRIHSIYECTICVKRFKYITGFDKHMFNHLQEMSNETSPSVDQLKPIIKYNLGKRNWLIAEEGNPKMAPMTCCNTEFRNNTAYKRHYRSEHPGQACPLLEDPAVCDLCGLLYEKKLLERHLQTHKDPSERRFVCQYCPKVLTSQQGLKQHQLVHSDQKPFKCPKCPKCYKKQSCLKAHQLKCGKKLDEIERPFVCDICGNKFIAKTTLQAHVLALHLGVKQPQQKEWKKQNNFATI